jgi:transcriptional regulator with XRE-family HTH domain
MARGHLRWSVTDLARHSGVGSSTIKRAESVDGVPSINIPNLNAILAALERAGIEFLPGNGVGPGVRMRKPAEQSGGETPTPAEPMARQDVAQHQIEPEQGATPDPTPEPGQDEPGQGLPPG